MPESDILSALLDIQTAHLCGDEIEAARIAASALVYIASDGRYHAEKWSEVNFRFDVRDWPLPTPAMELGR